jgi:hypothetical protein
MQTLVPIKKNGSFTEQHLETAKEFDLINQGLYPEYYDDSEFKSIVYHGLHLIDSSSIERNVHGTSQSVRADGKNDKYDEISAEMESYGYKLGGGKFLWIKPHTEKPGRYLIVDGKTKDKILEEKKFKNRICHVIDIDDSECVQFGNRLNSGEDSPAAGLVKEVDIITAANNQIRDGLLELNVDDIHEFINKALGRGKFGKKKRLDLANQIYSHEAAIQTSGLLPTAWVSGADVSNWMTANKYIETPTVKYLVVAASSPMKAFIAAAKESRQNPGKEIRVVVYVSKLNGYILKKCYIDTILKFKAFWYDYLSVVSVAYFNNAKSTDHNIKLYGCVPSNIQDICEDMEKLIVFGKNDQKIDINYISNTSLNMFFEEEEDQEEDYV